MLRPYPIWLIQGFKAILDDCGLMDLCLNGYPYTWERKYGEDSWIEIRLDRTLASTSFIHRFRDVTLINLEVSTSDHAPVLLELHKVFYTAQIKRFWFGNAWIRELMCKQLVAETWNVISTNKNCLVFSIAMEVGTGDNRQFQI